MPVIWGGELPVGFDALGKRYECSAYGKCWPKAAGPLWSGNKRQLLLGAPVTPANGEPVAAVGPPFMLICSILPFS